MNDVRLARLLKSRSDRIKGCETRDMYLNNGALQFRVYDESGAIFNVDVSVYKDRI